MSGNQIAAAFVLSGAYMYIAALDERLQVGAPRCAPVLPVLWNAFDPLPPHATLTSLPARCIWQKSPTGNILVRGLSLSLCQPLSVCGQLQFLSGLCLCKGEAKFGPGRPGPPILNIWAIIVGG